LGGKSPSREKFTRASTSSSIDLYDQAVQSLLDLSAREHLVLLCAESDPANCHRQHVIAQTLLNAGARVVHIMKNGQLKDAWLEDALSEQPELF